MWMSRRGGIAGEHRGAAGMGQVTIGGERPAVRTEGEVRRATVLGPAWFYWTPEAGADVMVLQAGDLGEEACVAGQRQSAPPVELAPGEAVIGTADSYIHIGPGGITLGGEIQRYGHLVGNGKLSVAGEMEASDLVNMDGAVYINGIFQLAD